MFLCYMQAVKDVYDTFRSALSELYDPGETEALTGLILGEVTGFSKSRLKAFPEEVLTTEQLASLTVMLQELQTGKPAQYITGHTDFYGMNFLVNPSVLIPRPETEELVEWIIETVKESETARSNFLDIGTGSGCIAIALKKNLPDTDLFAIDLSADALKTAQLNARINDVKVNFIKADALNLTDPEITELRYQIIVSNPPYVTPADKALMHTNVTNFEPHSALFVPQNDPLLFYKAIADFAANNLLPGGYLFFEINESYGTETMEMLDHRGFMNIQLRKDLSGRERMIKAQHA